MNEIQKYIIAHEPKMMNDLFSLIRIPSISALPEHHDDMLACAERWAQLLLEAGADEALVMPSKGNPIVFAQKMVDPDAKTVLVYAHYDVMPAEPLELWKSQPFEPEIRNGYIWARGADDDKGQSFIQVKAFEYLVKNGLLKNNVKFIFEGEEEIGSPSLEAFCEEHKELLKADAKEVIALMDSCVAHCPQPVTADFAPYLLERAQLYMNNDQARNAMLDYDAYHTAVKGEVNDVFYYYREQAALKARQFQRALDDIAKAIEMNPTDLTYQAEHAVVNLRVGRYEEAILILNNILKTDPKYGEAYRLLGLCQIQLKKTDEACGNFKKAKELGDPNVDELITKYCK